MCAARSSVHRHPARAVSKLGSSVELAQRPSISWRFRALVASYALSAYGNFLNLIALSLFTYEVVGSALGIGAVMALRLFSGMLAGLVAGALTTALGRRTVMVGADVAQALAMVLLAVGSRDPALGLLLGAVVVLGAGNTFFTVALRRAVPVIVGQDARTRANGLLVTARSVATVLGYGAMELRGRLPGSTRFTDRRPISSLGLKAKSVS